MILISISQMIHNIEYGNSLGIQWLGLGALTVGSEFSPWLGNQDQASYTEVKGINS